MKKDKCTVCGIEVDYGKLYGLFVPYACINCWTKIVDDAKRRGDICGLCHEPRPACCC